MGPKRGGPQAILGAHPAHPKECCVSKSLFEHLAMIDAANVASNRVDVLPQDRRAILLANQVNPSSGRGFDWLVMQAASVAKFIHLEQSADFTLFVFEDRSVLVLLSSGHVFSVANGAVDSLQKVARWLASHSIVPAPPSLPAAANQPFDSL